MIHKTSNYRNLPDFDDLPKVDGMPQGCAWGLFDKNGEKDVLGCLNLLRPDIVREALREACEGVSVSLNWPLGAIDRPGFKRKALVHKVNSLKKQDDIHGYDDEIEFNTQCSSQWDSLVHYAHQESAMNYNGVKTEVEDLIQPFGTCVQRTHPTLNHWHDRGGLVARGVLVDYKAWADAKGIKYDCFDAHSIPVKDIEEVLAYQGTQLKFGDVLIIRSGFTEELTGKSSEEQQRMLGTHKAVGVTGDVETARWIWNKHFAAVAGDMLAFETLPARRTDGSVGELNELGMSSRRERDIPRFFIASGTKKAVPNFCEVG